MVKSQIRIIGALIILSMLGASPLSITYSFAENESEQIENKKHRSISTEKMIDGELEVFQYVLPEKFSEADLKRMLSTEGQMSWAYVNYKMYQSGIVLFDGKISKIDENLWKILIEDDFDRNLSYKIVFSGKIGESNVENVIISLMNSVIKNLEMAQNMKIL